MRSTIESALEGIGRVVKVPVESEYAPMDDLIERGVGYAVLPASALFNSPLARGFPAAPVHGLSITWVLAHLQTPHLSLAARKMMAIVTQIAKRHIASRRWKATYLGP